jgi:mycoredoxin
LLLAVQEAAVQQRSVTVFWRPGCGFCSMLRAGLRRAGVEFDEIDIWEDPAAAEFVRSVAGGCETVPTVTVGDDSFVNPPAPMVVALAFGEGRSPLA